MGRLHRPHRPGRHQSNETPPSQIRKESPNRNFFQKQAVNQTAIRHHPTGHPHPRRLPPLFPLSPAGARLHYVRQKLFFEGRITQDDKSQGPFFYLPFDVPPRTTRIDVSYHYERRTEDSEEDRANVIDIGIFDPRGLHLLTEGFRGWTGNARSSFFITPSEATPGYLPGPIQPGRWHLMLSRELVVTPACRYWVNVDLDLALNDAEIEAAAQPYELPSVRGAAAASGPGRWYRGDLHVHSIHSDGYNTIAELAAGARQRDLDFLAITDHNTVSHHQEIASLDRADVLLVPGEEWTTYWGHANVWGLRKWADFRCQEAETVRQVMEFVHSQGKLFSINHPKRIDPWKFTELTGYRCIEVWQAPWRALNWESVEFWEQHLERGEHIVGVGGSDTHSIPPAHEAQPWGLGEPCTWVFAPEPLEEESLLRSIEQGHVFISEDPSGPFLELTADADGQGRFEAMMGDVLHVARGSAVSLRLRYRGPRGKKLRLLNGREVWHEGEAREEEVTQEFALRVEVPTWVRAEVRGLRGHPERGEVVHALTNPIYIDVR